MFMYSKEKLKEDEKKKEKRACYPTDARLPSCPNLTRNPLLSYVSVLRNISKLGYSGQKLGTLLNKLIIFHAIHQG